MKNVRPIFLLLILLIAIYLLFTQSKDKSLAIGMPSVILVTFGDIDKNGEWSGEIAPYMSHIKNSNEISNKLPMCILAFEGELFGSPVIIVVTGSGKVQVANCTLDILQKTKGNIKEVILTGTAGITPMQGGMLTESRIPRNGSAVMIGDVCINSLVSNFSSQYYTADLANTNAVNPLFWPSDSIDALSDSQTSLDLARELFSASQNVEWPKATDAIMEINIKYHGENRTVKAWKTSECMEVTDDLFWHDINADLEARSIAFTLLKSAVDYNLKFDDILITTAMESEAVGKTLTNWNKANNTNLPFAYSRGASNFDHTWLNANGLPAVSGKTSIATRENENGVAFASQTAAIPVLKLFELRSYK